MLRTPNLYRLLRSPDLVIVYGKRDISLLISVNIFFIKSQIWSS